MGCPSRAFLPVAVLSLIALTTVSPLSAASGAPRSVSSDLLDTLDCNQNEPEPWIRTLANGREVRVVSQRVHDEEGFGRVLEVEYLTELNSRRQFCSVRRQAWDLLDDLREEAEDAGALQISVLATNEKTGDGAHYELTRGEDGTWTSSVNLFLRELLDCRKFANARRPPTNLLVAVASEDFRGAHDLIAAGADVEGAPENSRCLDVHCDPGTIETWFCSITPLNHAAFIGDPEMVDLLLTSGADINAAPPCGGPPLTTATAKVSRSDVAGMLLARGADPEGRDREDRTPLMFAASNANGRGVRILLEAGANVNARDRSGRTPLMHALDRFKPLREPTAKSADCYQRIIRALLSAGADPGARDRKGKTLHDLAVEKKDPAVLKILSQITNR